MSREADMRWRVLPAAGISLMLVLFGGTPEAHGQYVPISELDYDQVHVAVAYNSQNDEYLAVWHNEWPSNKDIYGQRISSSGALNGNWFPISVGAGDRYLPDVAYNDDRNEYLVVWEHDNAVKLDIHARRVSAGGALLGSELTLGTGAALRNRFTPAVAYGTVSENYLVVWESHVQASIATDIEAQIVTGAGALSGVNFPIAEGTWSDSHDQPDVAYNRSRNEFMVVWRHLASDYDISARRVQGNGTPMNPAVIVVNSWGNEEHSPRVAAVATTVNFGKYMVVWQMEISAGNNDIYSIIVEGNGTLGTMIAVAFTNDDETSPDVAGSETSGTFMAAWTAPSGAVTGVRERRLDLSNNLLSSPAWIAGSNADNSAVAADDSSGFLLAYDAIPVPANGHDVYGWLSSPLFSDGFEWGTTSAWSASLP